MLNMLKICSKYADNFYCEKCDYKCSKIFLWKQHCKTRKHNANNANENANENANNANKCLCGKI